MNRFTWDEFRVKVYWGRNTQIHNLIKVINFTKFLVASRLPLSSSSSPPPKKEIALLDETWL